MYVYIRSSWEGGTNVAIWNKRMKMLAVTFELEALRMMIYDGFDSRMKE